MKESVEFFIYIDARMFACVGVSAFGLSLIAVGYGVIVKRCRIEGIGERGCGGGGCCAVVDLYCTSLFFMYPTK